MVSVALGFEHSNYVALQGRLLDSSWVEVERRTERKVVVLVAASVFASWVEAVNTLAAVFEESSAVAGRFEVEVPVAAA